MKVFYVFCFFVCALACITFISADSVIKKLKEQDLEGKEEKDFIDNCLREHNLTESDDDEFEIEDIFNKVYEKPENQEKWKKYGCVLECTLRELDWMEGSELKEETIYKEVTNNWQNFSWLPNAQKLIRDCSTKVRETPADNCQKGGTILACTIQTIFTWDFDALFPSSEEHETVTSTIDVDEVRDVTETIGK